MINMDRFLDIKVEDMQCGKCPQEELIGISLYSDELLYILKDDGISSPRFQKFAYFLSNRIAYLAETCAYSFSPKGLDFNTDDIQLKQYLVLLNLIYSHALVCSNMIVNGNCEVFSHHKNELYSIKENALMLLHVMNSEYHKHHNAVIYLEETTGMYFQRFVKSEQHPVMLVAKVEEASKVCNATAKSSIVSNISKYPSKYYKLRAIPCNQGYIDIAMQADDCIEELYTTYMTFVFTDS